MVQIPVLGKLGRLASPVKKNFGKPKLAGIEREFPFLQNRPVVYSSVQWTPKNSDHHKTE